jgi:hypothetical protein
MGDYPDVKWIENKEKICVIIFGICAIKRALSSFFRALDNI